MKIVVQTCLQIALYSIYLIEKLLNNWHAARYRNKHFSCYRIFPRSPRNSVGVTSILEPSFRRGVTANYCYSTPGTCICRVHIYVRCLLDKVAAESLKAVCGKSKYHPQVDLTICLNLKV